MLEVERINTKEILITGIRKSLYIEINSIFYSNFANQPPVLLGIKSLHLQLMYLKRQFQIIGRLIQLDGLSIWVIMNISKDTDDIFRGRN